MQTLADRAVRRLTHWRAVFARWELGNRQSDDATFVAVMNHRDATLRLRVEVSALVNLLVVEGVITEQEWEEQLALEAEALDDALAETFPGFASTEDGIAIVNPPLAAQTMKGWG